MLVKAVNTYQNLIDTTTKKQRSKIKIFVGLSGGVDSSLTAYKLKQEGFDVTGIYMLCFKTDDPNCKSVKDRADAVKVADFLQIPFKVWDLQEEYKQKVIEYFFKEYKKGLTPNPDVLCNSQIKFGLFLQKALEEGADFVATGHYAQIFNLRNPKSAIRNPKHKFSSFENSDFEFVSNLDIRNSYFVVSGTDTTKDQSYFLCDVDPKVYNKMLFPLGDTVKKDNRILAKKINLPVATKKDSTGICFLEDIDPQKFLKTQIKEKQGKVINKKEEVIGTHKGVSFYTIGQRHGFTINKYIGKPSYVVEKRVKDNVIVVGDKKDLMTNKLSIINYKLLIINETLEQLAKEDRLYIRIRNLGSFNKIAKLEKEKSKTTLITQNPLNSVAPGQFGVIYAKLGTNMVIIGHGEIA